MLNREGNVAVNVIVHFIRMKIRSDVNKSYFETREWCPWLSIQITTTGYFYPYGVPCIQSQYSRGTSAVITSSPPTWVSEDRKLELGAVSVQIQITVPKAGVVGHWMHNKHICPRHRSREQSGSRAITRSFICYHSVIYHRRIVVVIFAVSQLCSKPNGSNCKYQTYIFT